MTDAQPSLKAFGSAIQLACQPQNAGLILQGRQAVLAMPRGWVLEQVGDIAEKVLNLSDYWEYRRLLELLALLDPQLVQRFVVPGLASADADVREAAEDYQMMGTAAMTLSDIAHGRSGDKGNHANVAVIAYTPAGYAWLRQHLTADAVRDYYAPLGPSRVVRYEAPNLLALNFVLHDVLAGGASRSLRADTQGKTLALALLQMPIDRPANCNEMLRPMSGGKES